MRIVHFRFGHLWLGEIPANVHFYSNDTVTKYPVAHMIESHIQKIADRADEPRTAALQIMWATGGRGHWAFLGATFQPHRNSSCVVRVAMSADDSGLISQLAQAVNNQAIKSITERQSSLAGIVSFERAVRHPIDSDPKLFGLATDCLIQALDLHYDSLSDVTISEVLEQTRKEWYI